MNESTINKHIVTVLLVIFDVAAVLGNLPKAFNGGGEQSNGKIVLLSLLVEGNVLIHINRQQIRLRIVSQRKRRTDVIKLQLSAASVVQELMRLLLSAL